MVNQLVESVSQIVRAAGMVVGIRDGTEEPNFELLGSVDAVELRRYGPRIAAETTISADELSARSAGFRKLAHYIFAGNATESNIAMTAPVSQQQNQQIAMISPVAEGRNSQGEWTIRFFMPAAYTLDTLPAPSGTDVRLVAVPAETLAVLQYSGIPSPTSVEKQTYQLLDVLKRNEIRSLSGPTAWFYDPPWTIPFLRRNEVAVAVDNPKP